MANPTIQYPQVFQVVGQDSSSDTLTVQNTGTTSVYISRSPGVNTSTFEHVIGPGGDWTWPANTALFVAVGAGQSGQISYGPNGSTVNSGSTFSQNSNQPTLIYSVPITYPVGSFSTGITKVNIPIAQFASIFFTLTGNLNSYPLPVTYTNFMRITAQQSGDAGGSVVQELAEYVLNTMNSIACSTLQIPVRNKQLTVIFELFKANAGDQMSGTHTLNVFGSNELIPAAKYVHNSLDFFGSIPSGGVFYMRGGTASGNTDYYMGTKNGPNYANITNLSGATTLGLSYLRISYAEAGVLSPLTIIPIPTTVSTSTNLNSTFPMRPIVATIAITSPNLVDVSIMQ